MSATPLIIVVAAVVEVDGRFLVTRRPAGTHLAGLWEFPGGKIAAGESHADALQREIREELDSGVDVQDLLLTTTFAYPDRAVRLHFYRCSIRDVPRPLLGQDVRWVTRDELRRLPLPAADEELIRVLTESPRRPDDPP